MINKFLIVFSYMSDLDLQVYNLIIVHNIIDSI